jgi:hypothetical protein
VSRNQGAILIRLQNAVFAGTDVPADFDCTLDRSTGAWMLRMSTASGMEMSAPLLDWLNGLLPATGIWKIKRFSPAREFGMQFASHPTVQFLPDWTFRAEGRSLVFLNGIADVLPTSGVELAVHSEQSLAVGSPLDATTFKVQRGKARWPVMVMEESKQ